MSSCDSRLTANVPPVLHFVAVAALALGIGTGGGQAADGVGADDAMLASQGDLLRMAFVSDGAVFAASWSGNLGWRPTRLGTLPAGRPRLAGFEFDRNGQPLVLVEDQDGRWLLLAQRIGARWRLRPVARDLPPGAVLGPAGLELDRVGKPAVAYAYRLPDRKTFLRLITGGTFRTIGITREGFPESAVVPAAAPVRMPDGTLRVLETYAARGGGAILWRHAGSDWRGLFLSSSVGGTLPVGPAFAESEGSAFAAAWTLAGPTPGEFQVRVAPRPDRPQTAVLHRRARVEALAIGPFGPEVAVTERVGDVEAGLLLANGRTFEFDGRLLDVVTTPRGSRSLLLLRNGGSYAYGLRTLEVPTVSLTANPAADGSVELAGRVSGVVSGLVGLYREGLGGPRQRAGFATIGPDGSFALVDRPPTRPLLYRAVYVDPIRGVPFAALLRQPV
jgi:hypothetical protein